MLFVSLVALFLVVENAVASERSILLGLVEKQVNEIRTRGLYGKKRELLGETQCGPQDISDWIKQELSPKTCESLDSYESLCEQYEDFEDTTECQNLAASTGGGGQWGTPQEECEHYVSALQPDPYFMDVDRLNTYFGTSGSFPLQHDCYEWKDEMCEVQVVFEAEEEAIAGKSLPTQAPYTVQVPCSRCDF
jgi:hypothetical protein